MKFLYDVIEKPVLTEKTASLTEFENRYTFRVRKSANKSLIKEAVEQGFGVKVVDISTQIVHGKWKRFAKGMKKKPNWKKAIVQLKTGDKIEFFKGV